MRKVTVILLTLVVIAGGGAWYVLSYLPDQIRTEIDETIASLKPDVEMRFVNIDIDVLSKQAVLTDVFVRIISEDLTIRAEKATVSSTGTAYDALLEKATAALPTEELFTARTVTVKEFELPMASAKSEPGDSAKNGNENDFWQRLVFSRMTAQRLAHKESGATVRSIILENLRQAKFGRAMVSAISLKDEDSTFNVESVFAEDIDIVKLAALPRTLGGYIDWSGLNTGKAGIKAIGLKIEDEVNLGIEEIAMDGIKAGRLVRLIFANATATGLRKDKNLSVGLKKMELNDFPIITDFPKTLEEVQSFQTRHKSLIYGGFDIRGFDIEVDEGAFKIDHATMPPPKFGNTPSGSRYIADATTRMKMSMDVKLSEIGNKPLDPEVVKLLNGGKLAMTVSGRTVMDHLKKTISVNDTTISAPGLLSLKMSGGIGNLPLRYFETPCDPIVQQIAMRQITLGKLDLTLIDDGLAGRLMDAAAQREGISRERVAPQLAAAARANLAGDGSPESRALAEQIGIFLENPKSLRLVLNPERPIAVMALANPQLLQSVGQVSKLLGLKLIANEGASK